jgi:hypothetical protein
MRDTLLSALSPAHDLFNTMPDYSDGVWPQEMMQLMIYFDVRMLSDDIDSDDGARDHEITCVAMMILHVYVFETITVNTSLARREC